MIGVGSRVRDRSDLMLGTVTQVPAVDPDGRVWHCHAAVEWDDLGFEIVPINILIEVDQ